MQESELLLGVTPTTFLFFPLIGVLVIAAFVATSVLKCREQGSKPQVGSLVWAAVFAALLLFLSVWCGLGYVNSTETYWIQCCVVLTLGGSLGTIRERLFAKLDELDAQDAAHHVLAQAIRVVRDAAIIFVACEFVRLALELPSNDKVYALTSNSVVIEFGVIFSLSLLAYFLGQRRCAGPALVVVLCFVVGLAERFVIEFKQNAILPMELFALKTAAGVSGQYTYMLTSNDMRGFVYAGMALIALSFIRPAHISGKRALSYDVCVNAICALASAAALGWWFVGPNYHDDLGYVISYWNSPKSYQKQGILPSFLTALEDMPLVAPEGYDHQDAENLTRAYGQKADDLPERTARRELSEKQYQELKPCVVIVMNETFADLSRLDELHAAYKGPQFFKGLSDTLARGPIAVSVYGAGTCNTEFEVLTGNSLAFVGAGKYPYQMFDLSGTANLARQFLEQGYATTAIHPNLGDNWNRNTVYEAMGFERFLSTDNDFQEAPGFHNGPTDRSTYERILTLLDDTSRPQFVFDVTMQNHGGYAVHNIPANRLTNYQPAGFSAEDLDQLNEYLSCIQASDEDLEWFVGELRALERPVVLVFFGDHHPKISNTYNDAFFSLAEESELEHQARLYQTDYIVWANYDVAGNDQVSEEEPVGTDCLGALALDLIGAPLDDFQKAQLGVHQRLQCINTVGFMGTDGKWHAPGTAPYLDTTYRDMALMDFLRFGEALV